SMNTKAHALEGTTKHEIAQSSKLKVKNQAPLNSSLIAHCSVLFHTKYLPMHSSSFRFQKSVSKVDAVL
ncbi:MAG: hypothetical protein ACOCQT_04155, partial [Desulfovermiculus sp.]